MSSLEAPRPDFVISNGKIASRWYGLDDDTPYLRIDELCLLCGEVIAVHDIDVRTHESFGDLGNAFGVQDAAVALEHLKAVHGE